MRTNGQDKDKNGWFIWMFDIVFNSSMNRQGRKKSAEEIVEGVVENIFKKYDQNNNEHIDFP